MNQAIQIQVGQIVKYSGDRCNQPGTGALVSVQINDYYKLPEYRLILEDGREFRIMARDFEVAPGCRFALVDQMGDAEYFVQLYAAMVLREINKKAAKECAANTKAKMIEDLKAQYPDLEQGQSCVIAARNIRKLLKAAFPGVKFSVKTSRFSGGNSISVNVESETGPTSKEIEAVIGRFEEGRFNGMNEIYEYSNNPFPDLFGGTKYLHCYGVKE